MPLELSLPALSTRVLTEVELQPSKVKKWLSELPLLNVAETGRRLYSTLNTYNRMELEPDVRLELLEMYRGPIQQIGLELQKQYVNLPLPLPEKHKGIAEQNREFQIELAYGYKRVALAPIDAITLGITLPLQRAIHHLKEVLLASYLPYSPPFPSGIWNEIHALYTKAERLGVTGLRVDEPLDRVRGKSTLAAAYKHALLLDLADPYHLPSRMVVKIDHYLDRYADVAVLQPAVDRIEPNCQFLLDLQSDVAGVILSADTIVQKPERYRLLNTFELARTIHAQLLLLQADNSPDSDGLPPDFYTEGGQEMLLRLINTWGVNPKRAFRRNERPNINVDVAVGIDAINYWLNGGRKVIQSSTFVGPQPDRTSIGTFGKKQADAELSEDFDYVPWELQDESAGGLSLRKIGVVRRRVRVGDLIAMRMAQDGPWNIAVVRWIKSANSSRIEIGAQRLAPTAQPVIVKAVTGDKEESDFLPSLLLPAIPALNEPQTLITPCSVFRPDRTLYMDDGTRLSRLVARQIVEATSGFERIAFTVDMP